MEQDFRTTFIPRKPMESVAPTAARASRPMGLLTLIGFLLVVVVAIMGVGLWFYKSTLEKQVTDAQAILADTQKFFEPTVLNELKTVSRRMSVAEGLLNRHTAVSPFFSLLSESTLPQVRFSRLEMVLDGEKPTITLSGEAEGYRVIAQQSRVFGQYSYIRDNIFSNFVLTPKGRVSFDGVINPDPRLLTFTNRLAEAARAPAAAPVATPPAPTTPVTSPTPSGPSL
jgi:hypothetical protein